MEIWQQYLFVFHFAKRARFVYHGSVNLLILDLHLVIGLWIACIPSTFALNRTKIAHTNTMNVAETLMYYFSANKTSSYLNKLKKQFKKWIFTSDQAIQMVYTFCWFNFERHSLNAFFSENPYIWFHCNFSHLFLLVLS